MDSVKCLFLKMNFIQQTGDLLTSITFYKMPAVNFDVTVFDKIILTVLLLDFLWTKNF